MNAGTTMLTPDENRRLTQVGPGTPMGNLQRRYWQPIGVVDEMADRWTKRVRLLGEDLVLFKDRSGKLGLVGEFCPHRRASLAYGIPTDAGIRCPYHGWQFDGAGRCLEQPNEPEGSNFKEKVATAGYPVQTLAGIIFAYLGPQPAPLLPRWDGYVGDNTIRMMGWAIVPCNWLQCMENSLDPVHTEWLHGPFDAFHVRARDAKYEQFSRKHVNLDFVEFEYGIYKRRLLQGQSEESDDWRVGHPILIPNIFANGSGGGALWKQTAYQIRVAIDDENTMHYWFDGYEPPVGVDVARRLLDHTVLYECPIRDERGEFMFENIENADIMAWTSQGRIFDRSREGLGWADKGITLYRNVLKREMKKVEDGLDPMGTIRDPAKNDCIRFALEKNKAHYSEGFRSLKMRNHAGCSPILDELCEIFSEYSDERLQERLQTAASP
jgi:5,5'-dehydrodivanillate O-demethylase oxygenase subunit